jgi:hypothetical protein
MSIRYPLKRSYWLSAPRRPPPEDVPDALVCSTMATVVRLAEREAVTCVLSERVAWLVADSLRTEEPDGHW